MYLIQLHIHENWNRQQHCCENLKFCILSSVYLKLGCWYFSISTANFKGLPVSFVDGHSKYKAEWTLHLPALRWYAAWTTVVIVTTTH